MVLFFIEHVHLLHVGHSVPFDRSRFAYSTFSSTFHIFRILCCYSHSYFFAFSLCMVLTRVCAAHVFHCNSLAILFSSYYLAALASFSKFHVSLEFGTSLFTRALDTYLSPDHVRTSARLPRSILVLASYTNVPLTFSILV